MIDFKPISIEDRGWINELLELSNFRGTEYCFTILFAWSDVFNTYVAKYKNWLLTRTISDNFANYLYPAGCGDLKEVIQVLIEDAASLEKECRIHGIPSSEVENFSILFSDYFKVSHARNSFDYIYERESLLTLSGKKLQSKRNHISKFKTLYPDWTFESFCTNKDNCSNLLNECIEMNSKWCQENECQENTSMLQESSSVKKILDNFVDLKLKGGILRLNGKIIAFTVGERQNSDTFIVHIEKAFTQYQGVYQMINQLFIERETAEYKYINREDDAGDEGLRKAKLSYRPIFLEEKSIAIKKELSLHLI